LVDSLKPGVYDLSTTNPEQHAVDDIQRGLDIAQNEYEIRPLIDAIDIAQNPEELSMMTYISYFRDYMNNQAARRGTPVAKFSSASGPGVEGGRAKKDNPFTITTRNCFQEVISSGGHAEAIHIHVSGPSGDVHHSPVQDNGDGTYTSGYTPAKAGRYTVKIALTGEDIQGSSFHVLMEGANAGNTWADGPGLNGGKTGRDLPFTIHGVDADGVPTTEGGEPYEISITGPHGKVAPSVHDRGDGNVDVVYNVDAPGNYNIEVKLHGEPIKDSPWTAHVKAAPDASKSWAEGPGLQGAFDNQPAYFTVYARDSHGNPVSGDDCQVTVHGPTDAHVQVRDNGNGTYDVQYDASDAGKYTITATLDGDNVKNTPATVEVLEGADHDNCSIRYTITVQAKNKKGEPKTYGGDKFEVKITGGDDESEVASEAIDNGDGTYSAKYELEGEQGTKFKVYIKLNGHNIKGSPFNHKL